ncbi:outer membrane protein transport protein [Stenotrophomonas sp. MYb57]|uniref:OmpP1/FadL family transporter n=1 Tax=Stenotrophomonas sp. MYb57 TaxID=1827305 RepID=UPI001319E9E5|nr:outer membrane protein transport protein [Stenotrophomonas sp. MYb57]
MTAEEALNLPATLTDSISHQVNDRWTVMADVIRTGWFEFAEARLDFESAQPTRALDFGYRDTTFAPIGAEYGYNDKLTLRAGLATDQSPVTDDTRDVRVPDTDRQWVSLGATYRASESAEHSFGYTHLFLDEPEASLVSATEHAARKV